MHRTISLKFNGVIFLSVLQALLPLRSSHFLLKLQCHCDIPLNITLYIQQMSCKETISFIQRRTEVMGVVVLGSNTPTPEIPKALHNRDKLNPIVKTVKNF